MANIAWNDRLRLGVPYMDGEHARMVHILAEISEDFLARADPTGIDKKLDQLTHDTLMHFSDEEDLMAAEHYAGFAAHKQSHDDIKQKILDLQEQYLSHRDETLTLENLETVMGWLEAHILGPDKDFAESLRK